jgi:hypothetical protein
MYAWVKDMKVVVPSSCLRGYDELPNKERFREERLTHGVGDCCVPTWSELVVEQGNVTHNPRHTIGIPNPMVLCLTQSQRWYGRVTVKVTILGATSAKGDE